MTTRDRHDPANPGDTAGRDPARTELRGLDGQAAGPLTDEVLERLLHRAGPRQPAPAEVRARMQDVARDAWQKKVQERSRERSADRQRLRSTWALAAAVVIAAGLGFLIWPLLRGAVDTAPAEAADVAVVAARFPAASATEPELAALPALGARLAAGTSVSTGGGRLALRLLDGTSVRLDHDTRLVLDSGSVLTLEQGAVYVDTGATQAVPADQEPRPVLEVRTAFGVARDVGTQFTTRVTGDGLMVTVREGEVDLQVAGLTQVAPAGTALTVDSQGAISRSEIARADGSWSWAMSAAPSFEIEGRTLTEVLGWVARETGWTLRWESAELQQEAGGIIAHGTMEGLTADQVPALIVPVAGLDSRLEGDVLLIKRP